MASLTVLRALVTATSEHLRSELTALDEAGASFHPGPDEWCAKEVVGHIVEADRRGFAGRIRSILADPGLDLNAWDQVGVAASREDCGRPWSEVLSEFEKVRGNALGVFDELGEADLHLAGLHPLVGHLEISDILHEWPFHDREHLKQLLDNTRAMLWSDLGAAQQFTLLERGD